MMRIISRGMPIIIAYVLISHALIAGESNETLRITSQQRVVRRLMLSAPTSLSKVSNPADLIVLEFFSLDSRKPIRDDDLQPFDKFVNLQTLIVGSDNLTDDCIQYIIKLPKLEALVLLNGAFTNQGILRLRKAPNLQTIGVLSSDVTRHGIVTLRELMPNTYVEKCFSGEYERDRQIFKRDGCLTSQFRDRYYKIKRHDNDAVEAKR